MSSGAQIEQQENMPPSPKSAMEVPSQQLIADNPTGALVSTDNNDTPNSKRNSYTKRTSKRLTFTERAQRESEELVRNMGGSLELEGGRRTRSSTRGTPVRNQTPIHTPPSKKKARKTIDNKDGQSTPSLKGQGRGRGRKLISGNVDPTLTPSTTAIDTAIIVDPVNISENENNQNEFRDITGETTNQQNNADKQDDVNVDSSDVHISSINSVKVQQNPKVDVKNIEKSALVDIAMDTDLSEDKLTIEVDEKEEIISNNDKEDKQEDTSPKHIVQEVVDVVENKDKIISNDNITVADTKVDENNDKKDNFTNENNCEIVKSDEEELVIETEMIEKSQNNDHCGTDLELIEEKCDESKDADIIPKDNENVLSTISKENEVPLEDIENMKEEQELPASNSTDFSSASNTTKMAGIDSNEAKLLTSNLLHEDEKLVATRTSN